MRSSQKWTRSVTAKSFKKGFEKVLKNGLTGFTGLTGTKTILLPWETTIHGELRKMLTKVPIFNYPGGSSANADDCLRSHPKHDDS